MFNRIRKTEHKSRQAFTLVELIVVLVILAIIAAVTVPALTGYIKKARKEKYYENAHYALVAAQSVMTELYGQGGIKALSIDSKNGTGLTSDKNNINWFDGANVAWGDKVRDLLDTDPYILIVGVGYTSLANPDTKTLKPYTVYYLAYVEDKDSPAVFYVNGEWRYKYPTEDPKAIEKKGYTDEDNVYRNLNTIKNGNIPLQMYVICNKDKLNDSNLWINEGNKNSLINHSEGHNGY